MKNITFICIIALTLSVNARSSDFNYDYLQAGLTSVSANAGGQNFDADGVTISGSKSLGDKLSVVGSFTAVEGDVFGSDVKLDEQTVGINWHTAINPKTDFIGGVLLVRQDLDIISDTGNGLYAGIRHQVNKKIELEGQLSRVSVFDVNDTAIRLSGRYYLSDNKSIGVSYEGADVDRILINFRLGF